VDHGLGHVEALQVGRVALRLPAKLGHVATFLDVPPQTRRRLTTPPSFY
jgi:hypothetical protein